MIASQDTVISFFMLFARVSGFLIVAPIFSLPSIPGRVKIILASVFTLALFEPTSGTVPLHIIAMALYVFYNFFIGFIIGFLLTLLFQAVIFFGECLALQSGLSFAAMQDPQSSHQQAVLSEWFMILFLLFFISVHGHLSLLQLLQQSLQSFPLLHLKPTALNADMVAHWLQFLFQAGMNLALPFILLFLIVQFGFGLLSRTAPQLQLFSLSFPLGLLFGFLIIEVMTPGFEGLFTQLIKSFEDLTLLPVS